MHRRKEHEGGTMKKKTLFVNLIYFERVVNYASPRYDLVNSLLAWEIDIREVHNHVM